MRVTEEGVRGGGGGNREGGGQGGTKVAGEGGIVYLCKYCLCYHTSKMLIYSLHLHCTQRMYPSLVH